MRYLIIIIIFLSFSCNKQRKTITEGENYNIEINYLFNETDSMHNKLLYQMDSIVVVFEESFANDSVQIMVNKEKTQTLLVNTDPSSGIARDVLLGPISEIENLSFRLNRGKILFVEIENKTPKVLLLRRTNKKFSATFTNVLPIYE